MKFATIEPRDILSVRTTRRRMNEWRRNWYDHLCHSLYAGERRDSDVEAEARAARYRSAQRWHLGVYAERCNQGGMVRHSAILSHPRTLRAFFLSVPLGRVSFIGLLKSAIRTGWGEMSEAERTAALGMLSVVDLSRLEDASLGYGEEGQYGEVVSVAVPRDRTPMEVLPKTNGMPLMQSRWAERFPVWHPEAGKYLPWIDFEGNMGNWIPPARM